jgi:hypothetical protein
MLYTILYVSRAAKKMYDEQLDELLIQSREWNRTHGITGFLAYVEGNLQNKTYHNFIQILEGTKPELKDLFSNIKGDYRHNNVNVIKSGNIIQRKFQNWDMAFERLDLVAFPHLSEFFHLDPGILFSDGDCENSILMDFMIAFHNQSIKGS